MNIPPKFIFEGNKQKSILLKSEALQFYNFIIQQANSSGIPNINRQLILKDGSIISINSYKEGNYSHRTGVITVITPNNPTLGGGDVLYLDSGIIEFNSNIISKRAYEPGMISTTESVRADMLIHGGLNGVISNDVPTLSSKTQYFLGRTPLDISQRATLNSSGILEEERTCSYGSPYVDRVDTSNGVVTELTGGLLPEFIGTDKEFNSISYITKKMITDSLLPSLLTGKSKLLLQSIYGSNRNDLIPEVNDDGYIVGIHLPNHIKRLDQVSGYDYPPELIILPYDRGYSLIIKQTSSGYRIFLLEFINKIYRLWELSPENKISNSLLQKYNDLILLDKDTLIKYDAIILSSCTVKSLLQDWTDIESYPSDIGSLPAYSWKFNYSGNEGVGVTYRINPDITRSDLIKATKVKLQINISELDNIISSNVTYSILSIGLFSPYLTPIFFPKKYGREMEWCGSIIIPGGPTDPDSVAQVHTGTSIVYSYYDATDTIIDIILNQDMAFLETGGSYNNEENYYLVGADSGVTYRNESYVYYSGLVGTSSIKINNNILGYNQTNKRSNVHLEIDTGTGLSGLSNSEDSQCTDLVLAESLGMYLAFPPYFSDLANQYRHVGAFIYRDIYITDDSGDSLKLNRQAICIPDGDASSTIIYTYDYESSPPSLETTSSSGSLANTLGHGALATGIFLPVTEGRGSQVTIDYTWGGELHSVGILPYTYTPRSGGIVDTSRAYISGINTDTELLKVADLNYKPSIFLDIMSPWRTDYQPIPVVSMSQSMKGSWKTYYAIGDVTKNKEFIYNAAIGWA